MREMMVDLRTCKKIRRRLRHNVAGEPQPTCDPRKPETL
jgi:hypothetical protein